MSDIAGMWKNPVAHFQASLVKSRQAGAQTVRNEKQAFKTFEQPRNMQSFYSRALEQRRLLTMWDHATCLLT